jgi:7-carboxy-7-deazaguanine synthase
VRVSEVYPSVQGEGPRVGNTTVFLRFGGCNLRCPGWPCDTQHAIDPKYRKEWLTLEPAQLYKVVNAEAYRVGTKQVTLTGGEPFLQKNEELADLCSLLWSHNFDIECFSNGTLQYPPWAIGRIKFIMDWKLPGSGENSNDIRRMDNLTRLTKHDAIKFVCKDLQDIEYAQELYESFIRGHSPVQVYYGKVWDADITDAILADYVMKHRLPWKLNVQLHNYIWDAQERGR